MLSNTREENTMQIQRHGIRAAAVAGLLVVVAGRAAFAVEILDDAVQMDDRVAQVVQASNSLCWEMYRYHQQNPDYTAGYRAAKQLWARAGGLRDALRSGPVETEPFVQEVAQINELFAQVEKIVSPWGDGDRSSLLAPKRNGNPDKGPEVVDPGVSVNLPLVGGVQLGRPRVVMTEDGQATLERRRLHPNSRGSKRSLERELAALKLAATYLLEDSGVSASAPPAPGSSDPVPNPPDESGDKLGEPQKISPPAAKKPVPGPEPK
jgi:hypothetical protein